MVAVRRGWLGFAPARSDHPTASCIPPWNGNHVPVGRFHPGQTVVNEDRRINSVATGMAVKMPAGTKAIDGTGKFLIPGLWDMHVHAAWPGLDALFAPLFVANGVTGVRDMYGAPFAIAAWKQKYYSGAPW